MIRPVAEYFAMPTVSPDMPTLRAATALDGRAIAGIYNHYVLNSIATFEEVAVGDDEMARRIDEVLGQSLPWLVAERSGEILGYAYGGRWKARHGYRYTVESTIYLSPSQVGNGTGSLLYGRLLDDLRKCGMHSAIGGIGLPNAASVRLHEKLGFVPVAHFSENGIKFGQWIDVGYWQAQL